MVSVLEKRCFSIVILTHNRDGLLRRCLESLSKNNTSLLHKVVVVFNGESVSPLSGYPFSVLCLSIESAVTPAKARNFASRYIESEYILFLDDDVFLPSHYIKSSLDFIDSHNPQVFGGADREYPNSKWLERVVNRTLMSPMATAQTTLRHNVKSGARIKNVSEEGLTLANLWVQTAFFKMNYFNDFYMRNEENEFILRSKPERIFRFSDIYVHHKRRDELGKVLRAVFTSGCYRAKMFYQFGFQGGVIYFVPLFTFLFFSISPAIDFLAPFTLLAIYLVVSLATSIATNLRYSLFIFCCQILFNIAYMCGTAYGLISMYPRKSECVFQQCPPEPQDPAVLYGPV